MIAIEDEKNRRERCFGRAEDIAICQEFAGPRLGVVALITEMGATFAAFGPSQGFDSAS